VEISLKSASAGTILLMDLCLGENHIFFLISLAHVAIDVALCILYYSFWTGGF
jgi:hypothetical protein